MRTRAAAARESAVRALEAPTANRAADPVLGETTTLDMPVDLPDQLFQQLALGHADYDSESESASSVGYSADASPCAPRSRLVSGAFTRIRFPGIDRCRLPQPLTLPPELGDMVLEEAISFAPSDTSFFETGHAAWLWRHGRFVSREWKAKIDGFARSWPSLMHIRLDKSSPVLTRPPTEIRLMPVDLDERVATFYIPFSFGINGIVRTAMLRRAYTLCAGQYERKPTSTARLHEPTAWEIESAAGGLVVCIPWRACVSAICSPASPPVERTWRTPSPKHWHPRSRAHSAGSDHSFGSFDSVEEFLRECGREGD